MVKNKRYSFIDVLNILAIFMVLMLHTSQAIFHTNAADPLFKQVRMFQALAIPAVFIFFMISGAMLIDYRSRMTTREFFKKRALRVVVPLILWSVLWYGYDIRFTAYPGPISHPDPSISDFFLSFASTNINTLFWFFYVILTLYLVTPLLSALVSLKERGYLFVLVCIYVVTNCFIFYPLEILKISINNNMVNFPLVTFSYLGYFIAGYLIHTDYFSQKQENLIIGIGVIMFVIQVSFVSLGIGTNLDMNNSTGPIVFFYSAGLFTLVKRLMISVKVTVSAAKILKTLASTSLGIYIIHPFFIKLFDKLLSITDLSLIHVYLFPFMVYLACVLVVLIVKKLPGGKYIFP
ncbi:acyltransferase [Oenococcus sp.]|uniref:acyltransferase n=1 Tax=Oenococcus sp. TaxID=1979414 RepID=UPI0039EBE558